MMPSCGLSYLVTTADTVMIHIHFISKAFNVSYVIFGFSWLLQNLVFFFIICIIYKKMRVGLDVCIYVHRRIATVYSGRFLPV